MDESKLSEELQQVFKPLFDELKAIEETLDREEFMDSTLRLYEVSIIYTFHSNFVFFRLSTSIKRT